MIKVLKEVNRLPGLLPKDGEQILGGSVVTLDGDRLKKYDGTAGTFPLGLASDSNIQFPIQAPNGITVGVGYDYTGFARGGLIGVFINGGLFELFDDGRGHPCVITDTFEQNKPVYANNEGKITSDGSGSKPRIGTVYGVSGSGADLRLTIKLEI